MNATSRAILQTIASSDDSLSEGERAAIRRLLDGHTEVVAATPQSSEPLLLTQKMAATILCVSRVTIWRLTKDHVLHPVEILPGTWRYAFDEIARLARSGYAAVAGPNATQRPRLAA